MPDGQDLLQNPQQPAPQPPAPGPTTNPPNPQQQADAHHTLIGRAVSALMGSDTNYKINPDTGQTEVTQTPRGTRTWGKAMVLGAMLGLDAGSRGRAEGGSVGGFLGGIGLGGQAVMQHGKEEDQQKLDRARQEYAQRAAAQREQREQAQAVLEQKKFSLEKTHVDAMTAAENAQTLRTQQLIKGETFTQYQKEAENGRAKIAPYQAAGVPPLARDKTSDEIQQIAAKNAKASAWDWEQTGVRTVINKDGTTGYIPTFDAFDPHATVKVTKSFIDLMKKAKIDNYYPGTTDHLKEGQELTPQEFMTLKANYQSSYNDQLQQRKDTLSIEEMQLRKQETEARIKEINAQATRQSKNDKEAKILSDSLDEWTTKYNQLAKDNPNATRKDAFAQLTPKAQFEISTRLVKTMDQLEKEIKDSLNQFPPDQERANELKEQQEAYRDLQRMTIGAVVLPKPSKQGDPATPEIISRYGAQYGNDPEKVKAALKAAGWGPPTAPAAPPAAKPKPAGSPNVDLGKMATDSLM